MKFFVAQQALGNPRVTFSRLGYHAARNGSFERRLGSSQFPRLHAYIKTGEDKAEINVHLDMKPHTYEGFRAHQAEHDSEIVQEEMKRISEFFQK